MKQSTLEEVRDNILNKSSNNIKKDILKLCLLSYEIKEIDNKYNVLFCIVSDLLELGYINYTKGKISVKNGDVIDLYEVYLLKHIKNKSWLELNDLLEQIHFTPTLERLGYIKVEESREMIFFTTEKVVKKSKYYLEVYKLMVLYEAFKDPLQSIVTNKKKFVICENITKYIIKEIDKELLQNG